MVARMPDGAAHDLSPTKFVPRHGGVHPIQPGQEEECSQVRPKRTFPVQSTPDLTGATRPSEHVPGQGANRRLRPPPAKPAQPASPYTSEKRSQPGRKTAASLRAKDVVRPKSVKTRPKPGRAVLTPSRHPPGPMSEAAPATRSRFLRLRAWRTLSVTAHGPPGAARRPQCPPGSWWGRNRGTVRAVGLLNGPWQSR
jgi:hypothetical protein